MMKTMRTSHKMATINRIAPLTSSSSSWAGTPRRIPRPGWRLFVRIYSSQGVQDVEALAPLFERKVLRNMLYTHGP